MFNLANTTTPPPPGTPLDAAQFDLFMGQADLLVVIVLVFAATVLFLGGVLVVRFLA